MRRKGEARYLMGTQEKIAKKFAWTIQKKIQFSP